METRNRNHILLRYALVIVGVLVFSVAIVKKAADTCIIHADKWNEKAARMLSVTHEVMPERGDILAQNGEVMATNNSCAPEARIFSTIAASSSQK